MSDWYWPDRKDWNLLFEEAPKYTGYLDIEGDIDLFWDGYRIDSPARSSIGLLRGTSQLSPFSMTLNFNEKMEIGGWILWFICVDGGYEKRVIENIRIEASDDGINWVERYNSPSNWVLDPESQVFVGNAKFVRWDTEENNSPAKYWRLSFLARNDVRDWRIVSYGWDDEFNFIIGPNLLIKDKPTPEIDRNIVIYGPVMNSRLCFTDR